MNNRKKTLIGLFVLVMCLTSVVCAIHTDSYATEMKSTVIAGDLSIDEPPIDDSTDDNIVGNASDPFDTEYYEDGITAKTITFSQGNVSYAVNGGASIDRLLTVKIQGQVEISQSIQVSGFVLFTSDDGAGCIIANGNEIAPMIQCLENSNVTIGRITIDGNRIGNEYKKAVRGVASHNSNLTLDGCIITNCGYCGGSSGLYVTEEIDKTKSNEYVLTIKPGTKIFNNWTTKDGDGAGIYCRGPTLIMTGGEIYNNRYTLISNPYYSSGIMITGGSVATITGGEIYGNNGAGISIHVSSKLTISDTTVRNNKVGISLVQQESGLTIGSGMTMGNNEGDIFFYSYGSDQKNFTLSLSDTPTNTLNLAYYEKDYHLTKDSITIKGTEDHQLTDGDLEKLNLTNNGWILWKSGNSIIPYETVTVTFHDGGETHTQIAPKDAQFRLVANTFGPVEDRTFLGWSKTDGSSNIDYRDCDDITSETDVNLYAVWVISHGTDLGIEWDCSDGTLTIRPYGSGETRGVMDNYTSGTQPWAGLKELVNSVIVEDGVKEIGEFAFSGMKMTEVWIADSVYAIGGSCFNESQSLESVKFPVNEKFDTLNHNILRKTGIKKLIILDSIKYIPGCIAAYCENLEEVVIPEGVTELPGNYVFWKCGKISSVTLPSTLQKISGKHAFAYCSQLKEITIPKNITNIGYGTFYETPLEKITFEEGSKLTTVEQYGFNVNTTSLTLPSTLKNFSKQSITGTISTLTIYDGQIGLISTLISSSESTPKKAFLATVSSYNVMIQNEIDGELIDELNTLAKFKPLNIIIDSEGCRLTGTLDVENYTSVSVPNGKRLIISGEGELKNPTSISNVYIEVLLDANGGSLEGDDALIIPYGGTYGVMPSPTRSSYSFTGWYTGPSGGNEIGSDSTVDILTGMKIYAHWNPVEYTVTFLKMDGTTLKTMVRTIEDDKISIEGAPLDGFTFKDWNPTIPDKIDKSITFYPVYELDGSDTTVTIGNRKIIATDPEAATVPMQIVGSYDIEMRVGPDVIILIPNRSVSNIPATGSITIRCDDTTHLIPDSIRSKTGENIESYEFTATVGGNPYSVFSDEILVTVPNNIDGQDIMVFYANENGSFDRMVIESYDEQIITFRTSHFSSYIVTIVDLSIVDPYIPANPDDDDSWYQQWFQNYYQQLAEQQRQEQMLKEQQIAKEKEREKKNLAVAVAGTAVILLSVLALAVNRKSR